MKAKRKANLDDELLAKPIEVLGLPSRIVRILKTSAKTPVYHADQHIAVIATIGELVRSREAHLYMRPGMGRKSLNQIIKALKKHKMFIGMSADEQLEP